MLAQLSVPSANLFYLYFNVMTIASVAVPFTLIHFLPASQKSTFFRATSSKDFLQKSVVKDSVLIKRQKGGMPAYYRERATSKISTFQEALMKDI